MMPPTNAPGGPPIAPPIAEPAAIVGVFVVAETLMIFEGPAGQVLLGARLRRSNRKQLLRSSPCTPQPGRAKIHGTDEHEFGH